MLGHAQVRVRAFRYLDVMSLLLSLEYTCGLNIGGRCTLLKVGEVGKWRKRLRHIS